MGYLFVAYNQSEDFRVLVCAYDAKEAKELAKGYFKDSSLYGDFTVEEVEDYSELGEYRFDCDYVVVADC